MIEPLKASDLDVAARVLALAFRDNPGVCGILNGEPPDVRRRRLERGMRGIAEATQRYGLAEVVKATDEIIAVSLAFPPGTFPPPLRASLIVARATLIASPRHAIRFARVDHWLHKRHPRHPHWYLWMLGVAPDRQGQGIGSTLLRTLSARADADGVPSYLETDRASSVRLYERHGYQTQSRTTQPLIDVPIWFMLRARPLDDGG